LVIGAVLTKHRIDQQRLPLGLGHGVGVALHFKWDGHDVVLSTWAVFSSILTRTVLAAVE
jgi:hypothetical protein